MRKPTLIEYTITDLRSLRAVARILKTKAVIVPQERFHNLVLKLHFEISPDSRATLRNSIEIWDRGRPPRSEDTNFSYKVSRYEQVT